MTTHGGQNSQDDGAGQPGRLTRARRPGTPATEAERSAFLDALSAGASVTKAAAAAGVGRSTAYDWRNADPGFASAWDAAWEAGADAAEDEAWRRAVDGVERPVHYRGERVDTVREYSDRLLELTLKARRPERWSDRVQVASVSVSMTPEQLAAARAAGLRPEVEEAAALLASIPPHPAEGTGAA